MKKIVITGASGFIGQALYAYLLDKKFNPFNISLRTAEDVKKVDLSSVDVIIHLAALVHQMQGASHDAYRQSNFELTKLLAEKAKLSGVGKFIFISTVKVYGESSEQVHLNERSKCVPEDPYGTSKLLAENALKHLSSDAFNVAILRLPMVYGPKVKGNFISLLKMHASKPIIPFKNIKTQRSMVFVGNVCAMINKLIAYKGKQQVFLAADSLSAMKLNRLSELFLSNLMSRKFVLSCAFPSFLVVMLKKIKPHLHARLFQDFVIDASATFKELKYSPQYSQEEAIAETCRWYQLKED